MVWSFSGSLAGKKSRRRLARVVEKDRCWQLGLDEEEVAAAWAANRRPAMEEAEAEVEDEQARLSWVACFGEQSLAFALGTNMLAGGVINTSGIVFQYGNWEEDTIYNVLTVGVFLVPEEIEDALGGCPASGSGRAYM